MQAHLVIIFHYHHKIQGEREENEAEEDEDVLSFIYLLMVSSVMKYCHVIVRKGQSQRLFLKVMHRQIIEISKECLNFLLSSVSKEIRNIN